MGSGLRRSDGSIPQPLKRNSTPCRRPAQCSMLAASMNAIAKAAKVRIEPMTPADWPAVRRIYAAGIATGNATFETAAPDWDAWHRSHLPQCRLVARPAGDDTLASDTMGGDTVLAWAALSPVSARACYAGIAEHSVYVDATRRGQGIGKTLLAALSAASEDAGFWMLQSAIFPENAASIAIHLACGFRIMGRRKRVAMLHGVWRDTVVVERRSRIVGV